MTVLDLQTEVDDCEITIAMTSITETTVPVVEARISDWNDDLCDHSPSLWSGDLDLDLIGNEIAVGQFFAVADAEDENLGWIHGPFATADEAAKAAVTAEMTEEYQRPLTAIAVIVDF